MRTHRLLSPLVALFAALASHAVAADILPLASVTHGLKVSANHRYLVDAQNAAPIFLLADTAWNLGSLKLDEVDRYLQSRAEHGFNAVMFAVNFAPQADEKNAEGEAAYVGADRTELNPVYFKYCDTVVERAAARGLYVMLYALWAGETAGTMNRYTPAQLTALGQALGHRYRGVPNVILCAGGEASPHYIEVERVNALGQALKDGCEGQNLVTVHPVSGHSTSAFYAEAPWLDFYLSQAKSGQAPANAAYDAAALVLADWSVTNVRPTMMGEHRYESGTVEDPLIQRRSLYQCVFAGGCGYAYGHNALWQMTPHTAQPWMLKGWNPGVAHWTEALDTPAVRQLRHIATLLRAHPYLSRIPDQSLVLAGQGPDVASRVQATRDGTLGKNDATYALVYLSSPLPVTIDTGVITAPRLNIHWFDPATGISEPLYENLPNPGRLVLEKRPQGVDAVAVIEAAIPATSAPATLRPEPPIRVLILDGFSNHHWKLNTALIRGILAPTHLFTVDVSTAPPRKDSPGWDTWRPKFSDYDVVIQTCNDINGGPSWPREVQTALEAYVSHGGGLYVWHSGNNAFADWPAYNDMIGLGWRKKEFGPALAIGADEQLVTIPAGEGQNTGHGARVNTVVHRLGDHPIHAGLPRAWLTPDIEVYFYARGPAKNLTVLSYGFDPRTKMNWPLEWIVAYGEGHVYTSTFGHVWKGDTQPERMRCAGVQTVVIRSLQWLARRDVTFPVPADFPTAGKISVRGEVPLPTPAAQPAPLRPAASP